MDAERENWASINFGINVAIPDSMFPESRNIHTNLKQDGNTSNVNEYTFHTWTKFHNQVLIPITADQIFNDSLCMISYS